MRSLLALASLLAATSHVLVAAETVLGAYIFHRHGDRTAKAWPPTKYTALGAQQVYISGAWFRSHYINGSSPILNISEDLVTLSQLSVTAPEDNVLQSSAITFTQALYPAAGSAAAQTLADGDVTEAPLGGYQYIPVNIVSSASSSSGAEDSGWLQGSSGCAKAVTSSNNYLQSQEYLDYLDKTAAFYQDLLPVYNTTYSSSEATFQNAYTIFDLVHVAQIHNATIASDDLLTNETVHQLQTLADAHEWGLAYNESEPVRAIAGAVLAGQIMQALNETLAEPLNKTSAQRLTVQFGAYGTFMAFFGLANLTAASPDFRGLVDYASSITFELVTNATVSGSDAPNTIDTADVSVRFLFANGSASDDNVPQYFPLFGQSETTLSWADFSAGMSAFDIEDTSAWCTACGNTTGVCADSTSSSGSDSGSSSSSSANSSDNSITPGIAAGIGILSLFGLILVLAIAGFLAGFRVVKKGAHAAAGAAAGAASAADADAGKKA